MRLIDADALIKKVTEMQEEIRLNEYMDSIYRERERPYLEPLKKMVNDQPTVERKRGEWIELELPEDNEELYDLADEGRTIICTSCGDEFNYWVEECRYCPHCGAEMKHV